MSTLNDSLALIGKDIVQVLKDNGNKAMTQDELFVKRKLINYSEYGWSFALDKLVKEKKIIEKNYDKNGNLKYIAM
jgi:hypothetical protein